MRGEFSPLATVRIEALCEFAAPGSVLLYLTGDTGQSVGVIALGRTRISVGTKTSPCWNIRGIFPGGKTD